MATKLINIAVPCNWDFPEIMNTFNPEENAFILTTGSEMIKEARNLIAGLSQKEIYNKIREETKDEIRKLELDLLVQKELTGRLDVSIRQFYEGQLEKMKRQIEDMNKQMNSYINDNECLIKDAVEKEREKNRMVLEEKEKRLNRMTETYEIFLKQSAENKSSKKLGDEGEENFILLSETFKDFVGYKLEKKSHQAHKGDFHLFFKEFSVLVDLKNYSGSVQKKELEKIEHDLTINNTIDFAWLISYDSNVSDWNRFPIMYKWVVTEIGLKCIIIVNNLNANKNQIDVLRNVWSITNEFNNMINKTKLDDEDIKKMRERDFNVVQKIKTTQKRLSELKRNVTTMSQITRDIENDIIDALSLLSNEIVQNEWNKNTKIKQWWDLNIDFSGDINDKLSSTELWNKFKKEIKPETDDDKILLEDFKNYVKTFVDIEHYIEKSKKGSIELIGFKLKEVLVEEPSLNVELNIPVVSSGKKKKIIKNKSNQKILIDEDTDNNIIMQYNTTDDDVIKISNDNKIMVWQVVSILVNNKVIEKRGDARGYEIYKETDEYKSKLTKK